jgi:hypothetical protein
MVLPITSSGTFYCTADDVGRILGVGRNYFTTTTSPTLDDVNMIINMEEDEIDRETQNSWRIRAANDGRWEYHTLGRIGLRGSWFVWLGYPVFLKYRKIPSFSAAAGDAIEVFNGNAWEDWIATKIEGIGQDYWVDYDAGIIFFRGLWVYMGLKEYVLRIKYRYGSETNVPRDISLACAYLAAAQLISTSDRLMLLPEGGTQTVSASKKYDDYRERAIKILEQHREWACVGG